MRNCVLALMLLSSFACIAQSKQDKAQIYEILNRQVQDWNNGRIDEFMKAYWESDSLMFVGKAGITYGYKGTYENYLKRYPDLATMGKLKFDYLNFSFPTPNSAFVVGKFHLTRPEKGDAEGFYTLLWKKIKGKWVIICDHTSS